MRHKITWYADFVLLGIGAIVIAVAGLTVGWGPKPFLGWLLGVIALPLILIGLFWAMRWTEFDERGITIQYFLTRDFIPWNKVVNSQVVLLEQTWKLHLQISDRKPVSMPLCPDDLAPVAQLIRDFAALSESDKKGPGDVEIERYEFANRVLDYSWPVMLFGLGVFLTGLSLLIAKELYDGSRSSKWPQARGTIHSARVESNAGKKGGRIRPKSMRYTPAVEYSYLVDGKQYNGDRVSFSPDSTPDSKAVSAYLHELTENDHVSVYYDPNAPQVSTLKTGVEGDRQLAAVALFVATAVSYGWSIRKYVQVRRRYAIASHPMMFDVDD